MKQILSAIAISIMLINFISNAQDITNTLAPNGNFKVKDSSTDYLNLNQATGNLSLFRNFELGGYPNSGINYGIITKGGIRFIHNYQAFGSDGYNTFIGLNAGNFTMSGTAGESSYNTAVGNEALQNLTTGYWNTTVGTYSLYNNTSGYYNCALGYSALFNNTTGSSNTAIGTNSLYNLSTGIGNTAVGAYTLLMSTVANWNVAIGNNALLNNTTGESNTAIGSYSLLSNSEGNGNIAIGMNSLRRRRMRTRRKHSR